MLSWENALISLTHFSQCKAEILLAVPPTWTNSENPSEGSGVSSMPDGCVVNTRECSVHSNPPPPTWCLGPLVYLFSLTSNFLKVFFFYNTLRTDFSLGPHLSCPLLLRLWGCWSRPCSSFPSWPCLHTLPPQCLPSHPAFVLPWPSWNREGVRYIVLVSSGPRHDALSQQGLYK